MRTKESVLDEVAKAEGLHDATQMVCIDGYIDGVYIAMDQYASELAKEQAIAFAKFVSLRYKPHGDNYILKADYSGMVYFPQELYAQFIESQSSHQQ